MTDRERIAALLGFDPSPEKSPSATGTPIPAVVTAAELCALTGVSQNAGRELASRKIWVRVGTKGFNTRESIRNHVTELARTAKRGNVGAELDRERVRVQKATAEKLELANAEARRELIPAAEVEREWAAVLRDIRAAMLALPSRVQQRLGHLSAHDLTTMDQEIRGALAEIANAE